ncbi:MAG: hypothetical protein J1E05_05255 [Eubacterium sp.]|nr:hypothetical protein [Eubacterium sp.]
MNNKNRTLENLRKSHKGKVYIYLKDTETCKRFLRDAENEGYRFGNIKPTENLTDDIIALEHRKRLSYVGFVGRVAWMCNGGTDAKEKFHRIDYDKFVSGEKDFYFKESPSPKRKELKAHIVKEDELWKR